MCLLPISPFPHSPFLVSHFLVPTFKATPSFVPSRIFPAGHETTSYLVGLWWPRSALRRRVRGTAVAPHFVRTTSVVFPHRFRSIPAIIPHIIVPAVFPHCYYSVVFSAASPQSFRIVPAVSPHCCRSPSAVFF